MSFSRKNFSTWKLKSTWCVGDTTVRSQFLSSRRNIIFDTISQNMFEPHQYQFFSVSFYFLNFSIPFLSHFLTQVPNLTVTNIQFCKYVIIPVLMSKILPWHGRRILIILSIINLHPHHLLIWRIREGQVAKHRLKSKPML